MFGVWFLPTDWRTAIVGSSSCDMSDIIIHIICSFIQFMTVVQPVLQPLLEGPTHSRYAGGKSGCHFKLRQHLSCCRWCQKGRYCAGLWLLFHLWHYYITYDIHYSHYYKIRMCNPDRHLLKKRGQKHTTSREISVSSKGKQIWLNLEAPTCPAPRAGRQQVLRCPGRPDGCREASRRSWQDETDRPSHLRFWQ